MTRRGFHIRLYLFYLVKKAQIFSSFKMCFHYTDQWRKCEIFLGVRIEGQAILQGFISIFAESADETAQPPHLFQTD